IEGRLGFAMNPIITILEETEGSYKTIPTHRIGDNEGLLSFTNESWYSKYLIQSKGYKIN
ncbi:hypothetical protein ABK046_45410, partial [Streptomyces caeruleatus]